MLEIRRFVTCHATPTTLVAHVMDVVDETLLLDTTDETTKHNVESVEVGASELSNGSYLLSSGSWAMPGVDGL